MNIDLDDLKAFLAVARAKGFREGARASGASASSLSSAVRRVEEQLGARLLNRTTRTVALTDAGRNLLERLAPALTAVDDAIEGAAQDVKGTGGKASGVLRLNVPISAARLLLPAIVPQFLAAYPDIRLEVNAQSDFVDVLASGCDAGIRYDERLEQDMIAVPIGPRVQRFAAAASPEYLNTHGRPKHPRELLEHACLCGRFGNGPIRPWQFERNGKAVQIEPKGPLVVVHGTATDLAIEAAMAGTGVVYIFEAWLQPHLDSGALEPVLKAWWPSFSGPYLYYPGRRLVPAPLRAFVDFVKAAT